MTIIMLSINSSPAFSTESEYLKLLKYEYNNRAFSLLANEKAAKSHKGTPAGDFFSAYHRLEVFNSSVYTAMQTPLNYKHKVNWWTRFRAGSIGFILSLTPTSLVQVDRIIERIVIPYLPKLERLKTLSAPENEVFFLYILTQEKIQLEAALATSNGSWQAGTDVLTQFVEHHEKQCQLTIRCESGEGKDTQPMSRI